MATNAKDKNNYKVKLTKEKAYTHVQNTVGYSLDGQKELYDKQIHRKYLKKDDLVWLQTKVFPH